MEYAANYHTHTFRCGHAEGTDREYIETAIKAGYKTLGFSDHSPMVFDTDHHSGYRMSLDQAEGYFTALSDLKREYRDDIAIHIGVEAEYYPATHGRFMEFMRQYPCEYMLLGQHFLLREED
ncbi:MAG: PHP domain-containing protein, partial [Clostridia bacterium]|nr:PHP domain-containing protein [Clostridia bacterium]